MSVIILPWDERYVVPGGAGLADGTSWANAYDITQVPAAMAQGRRFNYAGAFTLAANLSFPVGGVSNNPISHRGWKSDLSAPSYDFADMPSVNGNGLYDWQLTNGYNHYQGLRYTNGVNGWAPTSTDSLSFYYCESDNHTTYGMAYDRYVNVNMCRFHSNGESGVKLSLASSIFNSEMYDNGVNGVTFLGFNGHASNCFMARNGDYGAQFNSNVAGGKLSCCTIDDNGKSGVYGVSSGPVVVIASQITNNGTTSSVDKGLELVNAFGVSINNNFFGNLDGFDGDVAESIGDTFVDPLYDDIANNLYGIGNTGLKGVDVTLLGNLTIGAVQYNSGGGGIPYRPRIRKGA